METVGSEGGCWTAGNFELRSAAGPVLRVQATAGRRELAVRQERVMGHLDTSLPRPMVVRRSVQAGIFWRSRSFARMRALSVFSPASGLLGSGGATVSRRATGRSGRGSPKRRLGL
jgi:hypothetical protein